MSFLELSLIFWEAYDYGLAIEITCEDGRTFVGIPQQLHFSYIQIDGLAYAVGMIKDARVV
jgi:hypothetical protein